MHEGCLEVVEVRMGQDAPGVGSEGPGDSK